MTTTIGTNLSLLNYSRSGSAASETPVSLAAILNEQARQASQLPSSTQVSLSDQAKAYLAATANTETATTAPPAADAASMRQWFDGQYAALGTSSAMLNGKVAIDLTGQNRATLSAIADNSSGLFSKDESTAAAMVAQGRFDAAIAPHAAIARHGGDYAALYEAALTYTDAAGSDEQATEAWQNQKAALTEGLAAARKSFGKAPATGNADDPVAALLARSQAGTTGSGAKDIASVAKSARAMLDDQADAARDKGLELVFDSRRKGGQQAEFSKFENRALAAIALNQGSAFSAEEMRAAKSALETRHRGEVMEVMKSSGGTVYGYQGLMQQYGALSAEEKAVLGIGSGYSDRLLQSYRSTMATRNALSGNASLGLSSYL